MIRQVTSLLLWIAIAGILAVIASGIADLVHTPCVPNSRTAQTAAVGGVLAQYDGFDMYEPTDANGNPIEEYNYYYEAVDEPCYDTIDVYEEPYSYSPYDDTYYYFDTPYSYPTYSNYTYPVHTVYQPNYYSSGGGTSLTQTIVPVGSATGIQSVTQPQDVPFVVEKNPVNNLKLIQSIVPIGTPTGGLNSTSNPSNPPAQPQYYPAVPQTYTQIYQSAPLYIAPTTCAISNYPQRITAGESSAIAWYSSGAISATMSDVGGVPVSGSMRVTPGVSKAYTLTVNDQYGRQATCTTFVDVMPQTPAPVVPVAPTAPKCSIGAVPAVIAENGTTTLTWSTSGADSISISGLGYVSAKGSLVITPRESQKFTLTAKGEGGTRTCSVYIEVQKSAPCTITCNGITYSCAPVQTGAVPVCPSATSTSQATVQSVSAPLIFWQWLIRIF